VLGNNLPKDLVDLARHVGGVAADVEVCLLQQQLVDLGRALAQAMLHVHFLGGFAGEGGYDLEGVAEGGLVFLWEVISLIAKFW